MAKTPIMNCCAYAAGSWAARENEQRVVPPPYVRFADSWTAGYDVIAKALKEAK